MIFFFLLPQANETLLLILPITGHIDFLFLSQNIYLPQDKFQSFLDIGADR